jgi:hypothetical protein
MFRLGTDHVNKWRQYGAPDHVINWISQGVIIPFVQSPPKCLFQNHNLTDKQRAFVDNEIKDLLKNHRISVADGVPTCVVPLGCVPKKNNQYRLITDLRHVNKFCETPKFRYEDISLLHQVLRPGDYLVTIDLKDGFHHIPISDSSAGYLGFSWKNVYYRWNVCPFGLSCSPYYFVKTLRPCIEYLRQQGVRLLCYMDDILIAASEEDIDNHKDLVLSVLQELGWHINFDESCLVPSTCAEYLGYLVDSVGNHCGPELRVPSYKLKKLSKDIHCLLLKDNVTARHLARIIGQCSAMCKAIFPGRLQLRNAYRLLRSRTSWESILYLTVSVVKDLTWWMTALHSWNGVAIIGGQVDYQVETDASSIGWGVSFGEKKAQGLWTKRLAYQSSNYRELFTVLMALKTFKETPPVAVIWGCLQPLITACV